MKDRQVVGLDLSSSSTGVVWGRTDGTFDSMAVVPTTGTRYQGYKQILDTILSVVEKDAFIVVEDYGFSFIGAGILLAELGGIVRYALLRRGHDILIVSPSTLKKFVLGTGKGKKDEIRLGIFKNWQREFATTDEVDAFALYQFGLFYLSGVQTPQFRVDCVKTAVEHTKGVLATIEEKRESMKKKKRTKKEK